MKIQTIMVGTDLSDASAVAVEQAARLAEFLGARIILIHVGPVADRARPELDELIRQRLAADGARLEQLAERLRERGIDSSSKLVEGYPDEGLCEAARDEKVDLLICGTHGRAALQRVFLGSVAERVVRLSQGPVMVAREAGGGGEGGFRRILVPTDFSDLAERALSVALALAGEGASIELFHCWQLPPAAPGYEVRPILEEVAREVERQGQKLLDAHKDAGAALSFESSRNTPAQGIQARLEQAPFDLVVMGSHGRRGLRRFLLGSVAEMTVRHAPCSVAVVHGPKPT